MRVLVMEDDHHIAAAIKKGLEQERYVVTITYDGVEGFDLASSEPFDVLIIDVMMPGMDGLTVSKQLRAAHVHTPILLLTAKGQITEKINGLDAGADDYMTKPFSFEELLARLRALTRRSPVLTDALLSSDGVTLDTRSFTVTREGTALHLSRREFSLLEYLLRHAHQVVSKQQIIDAVWDYESDILPNTVEVYIRALRTKIDKPFPRKKPLIRTARGFGYMFGEA